MPGAFPDTLCTNLYRVGSFVRRTEGVQYLHYVSGPSGSDE
jgi:hypothetical protein